MATKIAQLTVVGAINVDMVASVRRAPRSGETVADGVLSRQPGGKGANQAIAGSRLGAAVTLVGAVGDDESGDYLLGHLRDGGVDVRGVQRIKQPTGTALIVVDATGENSIVVCGGANNMIDPGQLSLAPGSALLVQFELPEPVIIESIARASGFVAVNASPARRISPAIMKRCDLFIVNEHEFEDLPQLRSAPLVAVTRGAEGATLIQGGEVVASAPSPPARVVSTVGAGDAFAAALTVGLLRGYGHHEALVRACAVGSAAVEDARSQPLLRDLRNYGPVA